MREWNYGDAYLRHPIQTGQAATFLDGSIAMVHDIFNPLPKFMSKADALFVDPPWNIGNLNSFCTKAGAEYHENFEVFYNRLFQCVGDIKPRSCWIEVGKEYLGEFLIEMKRLFRRVTFWNSTYFHRPGNLCYIIRGAKKRKKLPLDYMDEEDVIEWICANEEFDFIGDLCIGRGLVAVSAHKNGKKFLGTELNHKRLSVLLERLYKTGNHYAIKEII